MQMCILAGCDFVASLPGMGIKKAHAGVKRFRSFVNVIKSAKINRTKVPTGYEVEVQRAYWTFRHQRCAPLQLMHTVCAQKKAARMQLPDTPHSTATLYCPARPVAKCNLHVLHIRSMDTTVGGGSAST